MQAMIAPLCFAALFLASASRSYADPKIFLGSVTNGDTPPKITVTEWYIEPAELDHIPAYDPAADAPPVSISEAIKIARSQIDQGLAPQADVTLKTIELEQIDRGNTGETAQSGYIEKPTGKWNYKVTYHIERPDPEHSIHSYPMVIYVLMDGTVSERRERPQTKQEREENDQFIDQIEKAAVADSAKKKSSRLHRSVCMFVSSYQARRSGPNNGPHTVSVIARDVDLQEESVPAVAKLEVSVDRERQLADLLAGLDDPDYEKRKAAVDGLAPSGLGDACLAKSARNRRRQLTMVDRRGAGKIRMTTARRSWQIFVLCADATWSEQRHVNRRPRSRKSPLVRRPSQSSPPRRERTVFWDLYINQSVVQGQLFSPG